MISIVLCDDRNVWPLFKDRTHVLTSARCSQSGLSFLRDDIMLSIKLYSC